MARPPLTYLRVAVTSRCNLRCVYCRPPAVDEALDLLSADEIVHFVRLAVACGIRKVRVTGGEPLVRDDIVALVGELAETPGLAQLALTTNGTLLPGLARPLREAGLRRVNIGLSALDADVYRQVTRVGHVAQARAGLQAALDAGFDPVKVNVVVMRGINDSEVPSLAELTRDAPLQVRFIEYMPFLEEAHRRGLYLVPAEEILARVRRLGEVEPVEGARGPASAELYRFPGAAGTIGIIAPHSEPFCHACNRVRLTAEGRIRACLIDGGERDVLPLIRRGLDRPTMERLLAEAAAAKPARHSAAFCGAMHRIGG